MWRYIYKLGGRRLLTEDLCGKMKTEDEKRLRCGFLGHKVDHVQSMFETTRELTVSAL
jgi:hypothetical protein